MMKKVSNLIFMFMFIVSLNAKTESINTKEFGDSNLKIKIEYKPEVANNNEQLIIETITKLTKEMDPAKAAKEYLEYQKSIFEKFRMNPLFAHLTECDSIEESCKNFGLLMQDFMNEINKKENSLKQAVYFATFSDETINEITVSLSTEMQNFMLTINNIREEATKNIQGKSEEEADIINLEAQSAIQEKLNEYFDNTIEMLDSVLRKHYSI